MSQHAVPLGRPRPGSPAAGEAQLWLVPIATPPKPLDALATLLDDAERAHADRFKFARDRRSYIVSHAVLRMVLGAYLDVAPDRVAIVQEAGPKPRFALERAPFDFNLSHSGDYALIGASLRPIGVDLEAIRPFDDHAQIARAHFAPDEVAALAALPDCRRLEGFFACWTCKEAYVKALGLGLAEPLDGFAVAVDPDAPPALLAVAGSVEAACDWSLWSARPVPDYRAAAAAHGRDVRFDLKIFG